jgi:hypothetical protein
MHPAESILPPSIAPTGTSASRKMRSTAVQVRDVDEAPPASAPGRSATASAAPYRITELVIEEAIAS